MGIERQKININQISQFIIGNPEMYAWCYYENNSVIKSAINLINDTFKDRNEALEKSRSFLIKTTIGQVSVLLLHSAIAYKDVTKIFAHISELNIFELAKLSIDLSLFADYYTTDNEEFINELSSAKKDLLYKNWKNKMSLEEFKSTKSLIKAMVRNKDHIYEIREILEKDMISKVGKFIDKHFSKFDCDDLKSPANPYKDIIEEAIEEKYPYTANNEVRDIVGSIIASPIEAKEYYESLSKNKEDRLIKLRKCGAPHIIINNEEVQKYYYKAFYKLAENIVVKDNLTESVNGLAQKFSQNWNEEKFCFE